MESRRGEGAQRFVFILRIWQEPREIAGAPAEWRGSVENVNTHQTIYFRELVHMLAFIIHETDFGATLRRDELRRDELRRDDVRRDELRRDELRRDELRRDELRRDELRRDEDREP